ncbi:hypothetical protein Nepgr_032299 [Nepenthes gracilis]|uniref:Uncharacterized protein n=1 Tax=Nepenthes gracilis TaxID=150966 RepID=A0AAD3TK18_NEPGR|nr:hypothetical protein Nepgr_032299 [Nepenthes gracilis]
MSRFSDHEVCKEAKMWYLFAKTSAGEAAWKHAKERGGSSCHEEVVASIALGIAPSTPEVFPKKEQFGLPVPTLLTRLDPSNQDVTSDHHDGDPSSCPSLGKLKCNLEVLRKRFDVSSARAIEDSSNPSLPITCLRTSLMRGAEDFEHVLSMVNAVDMFGCMCDFRLICLGLASRPCTASTVDTRHSKPAREDGDSAIGHSQDQSARQQHGENERIAGHQIATNKPAALLLQIQHHAQQHHSGAVSRYPIHQQQQWRITSPRFIRPGPAANPTANVLTAAEDQHQQNGQ